MPISEQESVIYTTNREFGHEVAAELERALLERDTLLKLLPAVRYAVRCCRNRNDPQALEWTNLLADANDIEARK